MNSAISYSGINTKVKAMHAKLIKSEEYTKLLNLETVADVISFLKKHPGYQHLFRKYDEHEIHRAEAERIFINGLYLDYTNIYRFANDEQRRDLELVFFRYEVNILKACIRLIHNQESAYDLSVFHPFFTKHSQINVTTLSNSHSMEEYIQNLKGTDYYSILTKLAAKGGLSTFDYEMALDVFYFTKSWRLKDKSLSGYNKEAFTLRMGTEIDLLNIMWIYRSKKMYDMSSSQIFTYLIPINYKLTIDQLTKLIAAVSIEEFLHILASTKYKDFAIHLKNGTMEKEYDNIIDQIYKYNMTRYPASMTVVNYFLLQKDKEIKRLTSLLECIRYGLDLKKKQEYVL